MSFSPFDVCIFLGLRIIGKNVKLEDIEGGLVKKLFAGEEITIVVIVQEVEGK